MTAPIRYAQKKYCNNILIIFLKSFCNDNVCFISNDYVLVSYKSLKTFFFSPVKMFLLFLFPRVELKKKCLLYFQTIKDY